MELCLGRSWRVCLHKFLSSSAALFQFASECRALCYLHTGNITTYPSLPNVCLTLLPLGHSLSTWHLVKPLQLMNPIQLPKLSLEFGLYMCSCSSKPIAYSSLRIRVYMVSIWDSMKQKENHHQLQEIVRKIAKPWSRVLKEGLCLIIEE